MDETQAPTPAPQAWDAVLTTPTPAMALALVFFAIFVSLLLRRLTGARALARYQRWFPLIDITFWLIAGVYILLMLAARLPLVWMMVVLFALLVVAVGAASWLRSVASGIALAFEGRLHVGDSVRVGDIEGEIRSFGLRSVRVETVDGQIQEVPNDRLVTETVANLSGNGGDSACELTVRISPGLDPARAMETARLVASLTPLASPRHRPEVFLEGLDEPGASLRLRVRGFVFDPAYADHYRSDVTARLHEAFAAAPGDESAAGLPGPPASGILTASE